MTEKPTSVALSWRNPDEENKVFTQAYVEESMFQDTVRNFLTLKEQFDILRKDFKQLYAIHTKKETDKTGSKLQQIEFRQHVGDAPFNPDYTD